MNTIIHGRSGSKTVAALCEKLPGAVNNSMSIPDNSIAINWAYSATPLCLPNDCVLFNKPDKIGFASDKSLCRKLLFDGNISIPETRYTPNKPIFNYLVGRNEVWIGRPSHHYGGHKFYVCRTQRGLERSMRKGCTYWSRFYPKTVEYRVHCAHGKVLLMQQKMGSQDHFRWNHTTGVVFKMIPWSKYDKEICLLALRACKVIGLDFGAVDIMANPTDESLPKAVVCEINTSPKLCEYSLSRYAKYFSWLFRTRQSEHFDFEKYKQIKSFAWKNCNFEG
jgi:hypothetical protein